jgi:hypothetical protein
MAQATRLIVIMIRKAHKEENKNLKTQKGE